MISDKAALFAPAKVNLTLHVTGQRDDGYHLLDSLVVFADLGDRISLGPADEISLDVTGPFARGVPTDARNSVWQAVEMLGERRAITLEKNLPNGAGIGGGSADAAAILRHFGRVEPAADLGADVPVCLLSRAQRMRGIGGKLDEVTALPPFWAVLVNPGITVATPDVFKALENRGNPPMPDAIPAFETAGALFDWLAHMRNDLQSPACKVAPVIAQVLTALSGRSPVVRMSGSGATCFALFQNHTEAVTVAKDIQEQKPDWWAVACRLS